MINCLTDWLSDSYIRKTEIATIVSLVQGRSPTHACTANRMWSLHFGDICQCPKTAVFGLKFRPKTAVFIWIALSKDWLFNDQSLDSAIQMQSQILKVGCKDAYLLLYHVSKLWLQTTLLALNSIAFIVSHQISDKKWWARHALMLVTN